MKLGIFAKTFEGSAPETVLEAARAAGYVAVQYNMACSGLDPMPLAIGDEIADAVAAAASETGVAIASLSATYNMIHPDSTERERGRRGFRSVAAAAPRMGTRLLTLCTGTCDPCNQWRYHPANSTREAWDELVGEFHLILEIAERFDVTVGVEPELTNVISSALRARQLLDTLKNPRVRIIFDAANLFGIATPDEQRRCVTEAVALLGPSIALAHAKDRLPDGRFAAAGMGVLDYRHYLTQLQHAGFRGYLITHGLAAGEAAGVAAFLKSELRAAEAA